MYLKIIHFETRAQEYMYIFILYACVKLQMNLNLDNIDTHELKRIFLKKQIRKKFQGLVLIKFVL